MWNYLRNRSIQKIALLLLVDICLLFIAIYGAYLIKFSFKTMRFSIDFPLNRANPLSFFAVLSHVMFLYIFGLYSVVRREAALRVFLYTLYAIATSTAALMFLQFFVPGYWMGRIVLTIQLPMCIAVIYFWRIFFYRTPLALVQKKNLALIGSGPFISRFLKETSDTMASHYQLQGLCITHQPIQNPAFINQDMVVYPTTRDLLQDPRVEAIAFQAPDHGLDESDIQALLHRTCEGLEVSDLTTLYKGLTGKVPLTYSDGHWLLSYVGIQGGPSPFYLKIKRLVDLTVAGIGFLLSFPLMVVIGVVVRMDTRGPMLLRQERLGQHRRSFRCLKFRTMVDQAEMDTGPVWSMPEDPRVTRVGRWLRKSRLDELPQLINVIQGEMSLIGPRPIRAHFADRLAELIPLYELRFALKPGLTGWAQVNHPYADTDDAQVEKFEYELFYIQNASLFLDCAILIKTLRTVFLRKGR